MKIAITIHVPVEQEAKSIDGDDAETTGEEEQTEDKEEEEEENEEVMEFTQEHDMTSISIVKELPVDKDYWVANFNKNR